MASAIITTRGEQYINTNNGLRGSLKLIMGTGKRAVTRGVNTLQTPYLLNGAQHEIEVFAVGVFRDSDGNAVGYSFRAVDSTPAASYAASEFAITSPDGHFVAYAAAGSAEGPIAVKNANQGLPYQLIAAYSGVTNPTINITTTVQGLSTATVGSIGGVQLSSDGDWASTGAVVKSPKQISDRIEDRRTTVSFASPAQINAGTDNSRAINPQALRGSRYRVIHISNSAPQSSDGVDNDLWVEY